MNVFKRWKNKKILEEKSGASLEGYGGYVNVGSNATVTNTDIMLNKLSTDWVGGGNPLKPASVSVFAMESLDEAQRADTEQALTELEVTANQVINEDAQSTGASYTEAQRDAALMAAVAANERSAVLRAQERSLQESNGSIQSGVGSEANVGRRSLEAYDETENRNSMVVSFTYNLKAARQDEFGEAFFPTIAVSPDTAAVTIVSDLLSVYEDVKRNVDGSMNYEWNRKSLINALVYPDILNNDTSRNYPIYRETDPVNKSRFVDQTDIPAKDIKLEDGHVVKTAPIKFGAAFDLLGLSAPDYLLEKGYLDSTDQLDPSVKLSVVYMKTTSGEIIAFDNLDQIPEATFTYVINGQNREGMLNFRTKFMTIDSTTKQLDGSASALTAVTSGATVHMNCVIHGSVNLNTGWIEIIAGKPSVSKVYDKAGDLLDITKGSGKTIADEINGAEFIGYDVISRRINSNRRERGQLLDINQERLFYSMPVLAPISIIRPTNETDSSDGARLDRLINATYVRCSNAAVDALLNAEALLRKIPEIKEPELLYNNKTLGAARYFITPYYKSISLDVEAELNTLKSSDRINDVQAVLVNTIREMVYRAYLESNYKSAATAMQGENGSVKPKVVLGTDPYIASYLMVTGDLRTLGNEFDLEVVCTPNIKMRNKVIMVFGKKDKGSQELSNPLHFGNMLWRPELTSILPISRNGQISKELTVQPSFLHVIHCPIMMTIDIKNLDTSVTKMAPVFTKTV